jgi:hypothetical protein
MSYEPRYSETAKEGPSDPDLEIIAKLASVLGVEPGQPRVIRRPEWCRSRDPPHYWLNWPGSVSTISGFPWYSLILPVTQMRLPRSEVSGVPNFALFSPYTTAVKTAFGYALPRSNNVGCDFALASYLAEATTPQTVAASPMWPAASSGLRGAAIVEKAHDPNTADDTSSLIGFSLKPSGRFRDGRRRPPVRPPHLPAACGRTGVRVPVWLRRNGWSGL